MKKNYRRDDIHLKLDPKAVALFDKAIAERGMGCRTAAVREIVKGWLRNPDALPVGLPVERQQQ